jgi:PIN domain-containing protein
VKIFIDEDTGTSVARALHALNIATVDWVSKDRTVKKGTKDEDWIPYVGRGQYLLLSCNIGILDSDTQRQLFIREKVGAVFITSGEITKLQLMQFIMRRWDWLVALHETQPRPFAFLTPISGRPRRDRRVS